ncbi:hypothetical protein [uncultured Sutterella sp.]|uniref:hypothetical protein n=1 Tax=uncultured Sutterella sp. TaxID=286133 RepID=UPI00266C6406|nr:hypothetical protein [uncultured Sutterella sp.]
MPEKRYARRDPNEIVDIEHRDRLEDYVEPASGTVTREFPAIFYSRSQEVR